MRRAIPAILIILLLPVHIFGLSVVSKERKSLPRGEDSAYVIPSPILKVTSLEFDGIASDLMFLRALVFFGGTLERERMEVKESEWKWIYNTLTASTDLDPYFLDPYYFGQAQLTWGGNMIREAGILLEKGTRYRDWDWMLPFFNGFNHFYFLQENEKAAEYLMVSARRPNSSPVLATLAARLAYKSRRTESAIMFLVEMLKREEDESTIKQYKTRLEALQGIFYLEKAVNRYNEKFGHSPSSLKDLVEKGVISQLPVDPYGGEFYIDKDGSIRTTSNLRPMEKIG